MKEEDSGQYTCEATSSSGVSRAFCALLVVSSSSKHRVAPHQTPPPPSPDDIPGPPSRPRVINITREGATLVWDVPEKEGNSALIGYRVSVFTAGWSAQSNGESHRTALRDIIPGAETLNGWVPIHKPVIEPMIFIELLEGFPRIVVVRSFNSLGDSEPSPWSPLLKKPSENQAVRNEKPKSLKGTVVNLTFVTALSHDALRITWKVSIVRMLSKVE